MTRISITLILVFFIYGPGWCRSGEVHPSFESLQGDFRRLSAKPDTTSEEWRSLVNSCLHVQSASTDKRIAGKSLLLAGNALTELHKRTGSVEDLDGAVKCYNDFLKTNRNGPDFIIALRALKEADSLRKSLPQTAKGRAESVPTERAAEKFGSVSLSRVNLGKSTEISHPVSVPHQIASSAPSSKMYNKTGNPFCRQDLVAKAQVEYSRNRAQAMELEERRIQEAKMSAPSVYKEPRSNAGEKPVPEKTAAETVVAPESKEPTEDKPESAKSSSGKMETTDGQDSRHTASEKRSASLSPPSVTDASGSSAKKTNFTVVIDPGHGGKDPGAVSGDGSLKEKDITLAVAARMKEKLTTMNPAVKVHLTREDDSHLNLQERTAFANENEADLFISIHCNSTNDSTSKGIETFYLSKASSNAAMRVAARENDISMSKMSDLEATLLDLMVISKKTESAELATEVHDALGKALREKGLGGRDRGVKQAPFYVLLGANMPAILVECAFISNGKDRDKLGSAVYLDLIAQGMAKGAFNYLNALSDKMPQK